MVEARWTSRPGFQTLPQCWRLSLAARYSCEVKLRASCMCPAYPREAVQRQRRGSSQGWWAAEAFPHTALRGSENWKG